MKTKMFLIINILLLVGCCKKVSLNPQTGLPWGWNPMPHERIKSYFPLNVGAQVTYISEKGENKVFKCTDLYYHYQNTFGNSYGMFSKFVPYEDCNASVNLATKSNNNIYSEILFARIIIGINRINLSLSYAYILINRNLLLQSREVLRYIRNLSKIRQKIWEWVGLKIPMNLSIILLILSYLLKAIILKKLWECS